VLRVGPSRFLVPEDHVLLDVWLAYRGGGLGGVGHLPFAGGYARQPAALMQALNVMSAADAQIRERMKPPRPGAPSAGLFD
jgi:hypothetical protein